MGANLGSRNVRQLTSFHDFAVGLMLPVEHYAYGLPTERFPRIEIVALPDFHPLLVFAQDLLRRLATKPLLGGREQLGEIVFQPGDHVQS